MKATHRLGFAFVIVLAGCSALDPATGAVAQPATQDDAGDVDAAPDGEEIDPGGISFARDIRPLMDRGAPPKGDTTTPKGCRPCHYSTQSSHNGIDLGGLDLTTLGSLRKGGGSSGTRIVVPFKPDESIIVQALKGQYPYAPRMPKNGPFWAPDEIQLVVDWIAEGAKGQPGE
jgi:hypothetical protein